MKKPGLGLASLRMSFMGRSAPGAKGGVATAGGVALTGADAGEGVARGSVCACEVFKASKVLHATDMKEIFKKGDFIALTTMRISKN